MLFGSKPNSAHSIAIDSVKPSEVGSMPSSLHSTLALKIVSRSEMPRFGPSVPVIARAQGGVQAVQVNPGREAGRVKLPAGEGVGTHLSPVVVRDAGAGL